MNQRLVENNGELPQYAILNYHEVERELLVYPYLLLKLKLHSAEVMLQLNENKVVCYCAARESESCDGEHNRYTIW